MDLIRVTKNATGQVVVSARELHQFLGIGKDFTTWFKDRAEKYELQEGVEFSPILGKTSKQGGRPQTDYALTVETAKELSMVENNDKGKEARRYFIECERKMLAATPPALTREAQLAQAVLLAQSVIVEQAEKLQVLEETVTAQAPKVEYYERVLKSTSGLTTTTIAKEMGLTAQQLANELCVLGVWFKQGDMWHLTKQYAGKGYTATKTHQIQTKEGTQTKHYLVWTEKGRELIHQRIKQRQTELQIGTPTNLITL